MAVVPELHFTNKQRTLIMLPLWIGGFISLMTESLLNVAFPQMMEDLNISLSTIQWLATAYMLVIGILTPTFGFLLRIFPIKKLYLTAMILFMVGSIGGGLAQSFPVLLVSRVVQGAGTGMLIPILMNTVLEIYPPDRRGSMLGISLMIIIFAPAVGPTIAGLIVQFLDWHWLFYLILPFALLATILGMLFLKNVSNLTRPRIDVLTVILSTIGFGGLIFGIHSIENIGFLSPTVGISLSCAIVALIIFVKRQLTLKQPMLEIRAFRNPMFALGIAMIFVIPMLPMTASIILATFTQSVLGLSPLVAGLILLPAEAISAVNMMVSGRLYDRIGARSLAIAGFAILTLSLFFFARISASTNLITLIILHCCMTIGISTLFTPVQANTLNQLPKESYANGSAIVSTTIEVSKAFGVALFVGLMGAVQANYLAGFANPDTQQQHMALIAGANAAFTATLALGIIGLVLSFFIKRPKKVQEYSKELKSPEN